MVDSSPKTKKKFKQNDTSRDQTSSPITNLNRDTKINWSDSIESPRWGHGIGNPKRDDDGRVPQRKIMLEKVKISMLLLCQISYQ